MAPVRCKNMMESAGWSHQCQREVGWIDLGLCNICAAAKRRGAAMRKANTVVRSERDERRSIRRAQERAALRVGEALRAEAPDEYEAIHAELERRDA